jgi:hypothetical protein
MELAGLEPATSWVRSRIRSCTERHLCPRKIVICRDFVKLSSFITRVRHARARTTGCNWVARRVASRRNAGGERPSRGRYESTSVGGLTGRRSADAPRRPDSRDRWRHPFRSLPRGRPADRISVSSWTLISRCRRARSANPPRSSRSCLCGLPQPPFTIAVAVKPQHSISRTGATVVPVMWSPRSTPTVSTASATTPIPICPPLMVFALVVPSPS